MITLEWCVAIVLLATIIVWYLYTCAEHYNTSPRPKGDKDNCKESDSGTTDWLRAMSESSDIDGCKGHLSMHPHNGDSDGLQDKAGGNTERLNL